MKKTQYQDILYSQIAENNEPDCEDYYLVEIERKANDYDKLKVIIQNAKDYINFLSIGPEEIKQMQEIAVMGFTKFNQTIWGKELLDILNESMEVDKID